MKYLFSLLILVILVGCAEEKSADATTPSLSTERAYISSLNREDRSTYMSNLSAERKYALWAQKFDQVLDINVWNSKQSQLISSIRDQLSVELFTKGSEANFSFKNSFEPNWLENVKRSFALEEYTAIFRSLEDLQIDISKHDDDVLVNPHNNAGMNIRIICECSYYSDWCNHGYCSGRFCEYIVLDDCGTLWLYDCNGSCIR